MAAPVSLQVEFGGGAELLFDGVKKHQVTLPCQPEPCEYQNLLDNLKERQQMEQSWGYQKPAKVDQTESVERTTRIIYARGIREARNFGAHQRRRLGTNG